jgi:hypothetical protein
MATKNKQLARQYLRLAEQAERESVDLRVAATQDQALARMPKSFLV